MNDSSSVSAPESSSDDGNKQVELDDQFRNSGTASPASGETSEHQLPDKKESSSPQHLENYADIGLVRESSPSYTPSDSQQLQDHHVLSSFPVSIVLGLTVLLLYLGSYDQTF